MLDLTALGRLPGTMDRVFGGSAGWDAGISTLYLVAGDPDNEGRGHFAFRAAAATVRRL